MQNVIAIVMYSDMALHSESASTIVKGMNNLQICVESFNLNDVRKERKLLHMCNESFLLSLCP